MLMNAFDKPVQSNTEQAGRGHGFARMFDRVCAFLDERVGGASALIAACQSVADRFWHSKLYFPVCFLMLAVFMAAGLPVAGGVFAYLVMCLTIRRLPERLLWVVSVLAAFGHNAGQLLVAVWVTGTPSILVYAPALVAASVITGAFTGVAAMYLVRALRKTGHFPQA